MKIVTTYYLEMNAPSWLTEMEEVAGLPICECEIKQYPFNRFLYRLVGEAWEWTDKRSWSEEEWKAYAENDNLRTWVAYYHGSPAGYYELQRQENGNVEITSFGLAPKFIGRGWGGYLLYHAIRSAWGYPETKRVWVHTCTLDHPHALQNYLARGMEAYHAETTYK